jgi:hypothetical protein
MTTTRQFLARTKLAATHYLEAMAFADPTGLAGLAYYPVAEVEPTTSAIKRESITGTLPLTRAAREAALAGV